MAKNSEKIKSRPAGINDNIEIAVMDINNVIENNKTVMKAKGIKVSGLSTELESRNGNKGKQDGGKEKEKGNRKIIKYKRVGEE